MNTQTVKLIDQSRNVWAIAQVIDQGDHYGGRIDLRCAPAHLRAIFDEFEEIVNGQLFSFLDEIQEKIDSLFIKVVFEHGHEAHVKDLQLFPSTGEMSFKFAEIPVPSRKMA